MSLLIILPSERAILSRRRAIDVEKNQPIMHALDSNVFAYLCGKTDWASGQIGVQSKISYSRIALALTEDIPRKPNRTLRIVKRKCVYNSVQRLIKARLLHSESISELDKNAFIMRRVFWQRLLNGQLLKVCRLHLLVLVPCNIINYYAMRWKDGVSSKSAEGSYCRALNNALTVNYLLTVSSHEKLLSSTGGKG